MDTTELSTSDTLARREKKFAVEVERKYDDYYGVDMIDLSVTRNGNQWTGIEHTLDEWRKIIDAVEAALAEQPKDTDT